MQSIPASPVLVAVENAGKSQLIQVGSNILVILALVIPCRAFFQVIIM
jgi:hypothetical protein